MSTFVSVGNASQPFPRLLEAVEKIADKLPQPVVIQYGVASAPAMSNCRWVDYLGMEEFAMQVAQAQLLILHAGAGSVIHAVRAGKVPVVMPRRAALGEHVDDHQLEFALELSRLGKIVVCQQPDQLLTAVAAAMPLQAARNESAEEPPLVNMLAALLQRTLVA